MKAFERRHHASWLLVNGLSPLARLADWMCRHPGQLAKAPRVLVIAASIDVGTRLDPNARKEAYALAHRLSVEGRCREAPETIPAVGLDFALARSNLTKTQRKMRGADLLLENALRDPSFDGDFTALAARLGWTSGRLWQRNPSIQIAAKRWLAQLGTNAPSTNAPPKDEGTHEPDR